VFLAGFDGDGGTGATVTAVDATGAVLDVYEVGALPSPDWDDGPAGSWPEVIEVLDTDITTLEVDAITNAANAQLLHGGGVAGAIARAAGEALERESRAKAPIALGSAVATTGGDLPARWVIHAATMARPGGTTSADVIRRCTSASLWKAEELGVRSLALVAFGTGVGGFPLGEAAEIEVEEVQRHLDSGSKLERVVFCVRGDEAREAFERAIAAELDH
jgi:O-acetyl-ADP-ribose deacetylase (regulator of RNase III)